MAGKLLGLDLGEKRVGVAISDVDKGVAFPREIINYKAVNELIDQLGHICSKEKIEKLIIGLPLSLKGKETDQTVKTGELAEEISKKLDIPIEYIDERLTSVIAERKIMDEKKKIRQKNIDDLSAQEILQTYIDKLNKS